MSFPPRMFFTVCIVLLGFCCVFEFFWLVGVWLGCVFGVFCLGVQGMCALGAVCFAHLLSLCVCLGCLGLVWGVVVVVGGGCGGWFFSLTIICIAQFMFSVCWIALFKFLSCSFLLKVSAKPFVWKAIVKVCSTNLVKVAFCFTKIQEARFILLRETKISSQESCKIFRSFCSVGAAVGGVVGAAKVCVGGAAVVVEGGGAKGCLVVVWGEAGAAKGCELVVAWVGLAVAWGGVCLFGKVFFSNLSKREYMLRCVFSWFGSRILAHNISKLMRGVMVPTMSLRVSLVISAIVQSSVSLKVAAWSRRVCSCSVEMLVIMLCALLGKAFTNIKSLKRSRRSSMKRRGSCPVWIIWLMIVKTVLAFLFAKPTIMLFSKETWV